LRRGQYIDLEAVFVNVFPHGALNGFCILRLKDESNGNELKNVFIF